ncbi:MAG: hypothetical protein QXZ02_07175 [Candidatus Bathyarchaeia archaeon]
MLVGALMTFVLSHRKARLIAAVVFGVTLALEIGIGLQPFLTASFSSLAVIAIYPRKNVKGSQKQLLVGLFTLLLMLPLSNVRIAKASIFWGHADLISQNNKFMATVYIYKHESVVEGKEFYGFDILLHTDQLAYFDWIDKLEIYCLGATFDNWQPKSGLTTGGSISLTPSGKIENCVRCSRLVHHTSFYSYALLNSC